MQIKVVDKNDNSYGIVDLDLFMFSNFEVEFDNDTVLPRNDLMYWKYDYDYFIRLNEEDDWHKIDMKDYYFD